MTAPDLPADSRAGDGYDWTDTLRGPPSPSCRTVPVAFARTRDGNGNGDRSGLTSTSKSCRECPPLALALVGLRASLARNAPAGNQGRVGRRHTPTASGTLFTWPVGSSIPGCPP